MPSRPLGAKGRPSALSSALHPPGQSDATILAPGLVFRVQEPQTWDELWALKSLSSSSSEPGFVRPPSNIPSTATHDVAPK